MFQPGAAVPFKPGQAAANPGGRPRSKSLGKMLRAKYGKDARALVDRLEGLSNPPQGKRVPKKLQFDATELLLAYHAGRPTQRMDVDMEQPDTLRIVMDDGTATPPDPVASLPGAE